MIYEYLWSLFLIIYYYFPTVVVSSPASLPQSPSSHDLSSRGGGQQLHWKIHEDSGPGKGLIQATPGTKPEPTWRVWDEGWNVRCHVAIQENGWIHRSLEVETLEGTSKFFNILVAIHLFFFWNSPFCFWGDMGGIFHFWDFCRDDDPQFALVATVPCWPIFWSGAQKIT